VILKPANTKKWGVPYLGSKSKIIEKIAKYFPNADHFYDLFGGGFAVTHYMITMRQKSFKQFHYNELRPGIPQFIKDAIAGKYNYDVFKPEWISRERFHKEKELNPYIKIIWSFGNNGENYLFNEDIEKEKRSMHQAVVFDEFDQFMEQTFNLKKWPNKLSVQGKRLFLKRLINKRIDLQQLRQLQQLERLEQLQQLEQLKPLIERLQRLESLERLQQLESLERLAQLEQLKPLKHLEFTNVDYRKVEIKPNSVIYCDVPYKGAADYGNTFNHSDFFDWANEQTNPVFISEYKINDDRFYLLKEFNHKSQLWQFESKKVIERLYGNKKAYDIIEYFRQNKTK